MFLAIGSGCANPKPAPKTDFITEALNHPKNFGATTVPARYWAYKNFLVHFVSDINEQNKKQNPVIYVHGLGDGLADFAGLIRLLHSDKSSRPFYAFDLPPFGRSKMQKSALSIRTYAELLNEFVFMTSAPKVNLVCHSMGGHVCIDFALSHPDRIQLLVLIAPSGVYDKSAFVSRATQKFAGINVGTVADPRINSIGDLKWFNPDFGRRMLTDNPAVLVAIDSYKENFRDRIKELKAKTLIIWGRDDKTFSYENGLYLKENLANSVLYILDGAGHAPFETHAELVAKLILKFLK